jgi:hypothetical protein
MASPAATDRGIGMSTIDRLGQKDNSLQTSHEREFSTTTKKALSRAGGNKDR